MVATASLSSESPARVSEWIQGGFPQPDITGPKPNLSEAVFERQPVMLYLKCWRSLSRSKQAKLFCSKVLVLEKLTEEIAQEVLWPSSTELCGLRDRFHCDPSIVPTFESTLVFRQDCCSWSSLRDFFTHACPTSSLSRESCIIEATVIRVMPSLEEPTSS
uniref:DNA damage-inducible transcript 4-like protein n=1 Tax=Dromaius novaehollandiae TaxID=8790 RepID=A0A8C4JLN6_DRONO